MIRRHADLHYHKTCSGFSFQPTSITRLRLVTSMGNCIIIQTHWCVILQIPASSYMIPRKPNRYTYAKWAILFLYLYYIPENCISDSYNSRCTSLANYLKNITAIRKAGLRQFCYYCRLFRIYHCHNWI